MSKSKLLTAAAILAASDVQTIEVDVPEWGGKVLVQGAAENRDAYESEITVIHDDGTTSADLLNIRAKIAAACMVDEDGRRLFTADQVEALGRKSVKALDRVANAAKSVLGMMPEDEVKNG